MDQRGLYLGSYPGKRLVRGSRSHGSIEENWGLKTKGGDGPTLSPVERKDWGDIIATRAGGMPEW